MKTPRLRVKDTVFLFTDGAYSRRRGLGGWGYVCVWNKKEATGWGGTHEPQSDATTTNNRMEFMAILQGLLRVPVSKHPIVLVSDSQYCLNSLFKWASGWERNGWRNALGQPVKNVDLIKQLREELLCRGQERQSVHARWVKGHAGLYLNERADSLATLGQKESGTRAEALKEVPQAYLDSFERVLL